MLIEIMDPEGITFTLASNLIHYLKNSRVYFKPVFKLPEVIRQRYQSRYEIEVDKSKNKLTLLKAYESENPECPDINFEMTLDVTQKEQQAPGLWVEITVLCSVNNETEKTTFNLNMASYQFPDMTSEIQQRLMCFTKLINSGVYNTNT